MATAREQPALSPVGRSEPIADIAVARFGHECELILSVLGTGGMGVVYRALDPRLERQVAIKLLPEETVADRHARERLRREAMAVAAIDHPYIGKIFEIGERVIELLRRSTGERNHRPTFVAFHSEASQVRSAGSSFHALTDRQIF